MKQGISLPQIPKNLITDNKDLYDYLFGLQQALLAKQTDDYGAVDKTSSDLATLSGSVTTFIADNKASQAEAIAGTLDTKIITPHSLREGFNASGDAPVFACRAWVNFDGTTNTDGYCTIRASGNVSSVADNGTGDYTITFTTALEDANYCVTTGGGRGDTDCNFNCVLHPTVAPSASAVRIQTCYPNAITLYDAKYIMVAVFR
jgi:hypothetical protein